ncbi:MAG: DUF47 family protein [Desulfurococcaceae archaeon]
MYSYNNESIAEMNIFESIASMTRIVEDAFRVFNELVDNFDREDIDFTKLYNKIYEPKTRVEEHKIMLMEYLARLGEAIDYKQYYVSLTLSLERLVQLLDGASYRIMLLKKNYKTVNKIVNEYLKQMKDVINEQFKNFTSGLKTIAKEPRKTISFINEISKLENKADEIYREATFNLYTKFSNDILLLMMLRDILDFVEDTSDLLRKIGEELRYLALNRTSTI